MNTVYLAEWLIALLFAVSLTSVVIGWLRSWLETREQARLERQRLLLEESWRIYQASRAIYDETASALQEMLNAQRRNR